MASNVSTTRSQRITIWVIAIVMAVGTIGSFFIFMLPAANTPVKSQAEIDYEKQIAEARKQQAEMQKSLRPLEGYAAAPFDAASVTELVKEELVPGTGKDVAADSTINANYFGWTADGKIFDSTNKNGTTTPIDFPLNGVIKGWTEGLTGTKEGGVYKLTIPADKAYGSTDDGSGRPFGPLTFIVEVKSVK